MSNQNHDLLGQIHLLKSDLAYSVSSFSNRKESNKSKAFYFQIATTILSSMATVALGLKTKEDNFAEFTRIFALVASATVAVVSGIDAFYNHKRLWVTYTETLNSLYALRFDFEFSLQSPTPITPDELEKFKNRYQAILSATNEKWIDLRSSDTKEKQ